MGQITTVTLLRYQSLRARAWIFTQMGLMPGFPFPSPLAGTEGLRFGRLMGSGAGNGFGLKPNLGVYAFVGHWDDRAAANLFFTGHEWWQSNEEHLAEQITFYLEATMTHGEWGGGNPFTPQPDKHDLNAPVAVITRATIRPRKLVDFWRYVPKTSASVFDHPERKLSIGVGEYPVFMQATFSLWTSGKAMRDFAYKSDHHAEVVRLTRERAWYKEEMFTRFRVLEVVGEWEGADLSEIC
ncbi:MAG: hypothetical protein ACJATN_001633 [Neolewinella sp.]|jgi:hypothetical protein